MNSILVKITWSEGEPTILKCKNMRDAQNWAAIYNEKAKNPEHGIVGVSIVL